jgi:uncharacterized protein (TIGR03435 family)
MPVFARFLNGLVDRVVVDQTNLSGGFDIDLRYSPIAAQLAVDQQDPDAISIFTALREQLGLELRATNAPAEVTIVDRLEPPSPD